MPAPNLFSYIKKLKRPVFTTNELAASSGKSSSAVTQALNYLEGQGLIVKIHRGIWAEEGARVSPYSVVPFLTPRQRVYVSFLSALHLHGIIEQIPQVVTLASTAHTRTVRTKRGTFVIHKLTPSFFKGFDWYRGQGDFLIAQPEKALVDSLYLSAHKKNQYGFFPELHFSASFSFKKAREWVKEIPMAGVRVCVEQKLDAIRRQFRRRA